MKKILAFLLGMMVMATMIAGCGGDKKEEKKQTTQVISYSNTHSTTNISVRATLFFTTQNVLIAIFHTFLAVLPTKKKTM